MKIFRWLFSNFILILLIITVIYSYMYWGNLTGSQTPAGKVVAYLSSEFVEVDEFVNAIKAKQEARQQARSETRQEIKQQSIQQTGQAEKTSDAAEPVTVAKVKVDNQPLNKMADKQAQHAATGASKADIVEAGVKKEIPGVAFKNDIRQLPAVTISYSQNQVRIKQSSDGVLEKQEVATKTVSKSVAEQKIQAVDAKPEAQQTASPQKSNLTANVDSNTRTTPPVNALKLPDTSTKVESDALLNTQPSSMGADDGDTFVSTEVEQQLNNVDEHGQVIDVSKQSSDIRKIWAVARKSFYQRNYSLSEQSYKKVIENTEDNFDAYGELGNVYFNQGKNEQAASAYFEAASILIHKGQLNRARSLAGVLRHLDKSTGEALQKLMDAAVSEKESKS